MQTLRWFRVVGDTIFAIGAIAFFIFVIGLLTGRSFAKVEDKAIDVIPAEAV